MMMISDGELMVNDGGWTVMMNCDGYLTTVKWWLSDVEVIYDDG